MTTSSYEFAKQRWKRERTEVCPSCRNHKRADWLPSSLTKCTFWCPKCERWWHFRRAIQLKTMPTFWSYKKILQTELDDD